MLHLPQDTVESVITDDLSLFRQMRSAAGVKPSAAGVSSEQIQTDYTDYCRFYDDPLVSMDKLFSLDRELERALSERVNLKSGADLVIQTTEALHVIDVNSGRVKNSKKKSKEEALLEVNLEAAAEACRQIRLRNLSGIIIIDFINLKSAAGMQRIMEELRIHASKDPIRTQVVDMTRLGLVEMTRQKIELPLADANRI